jgi:alcohol dehydrogenase class IV
MCERQRRPHRLRPLKAVMTMTNENVQRSPQEIAELFEVAGRETEAIRQLSGCVTDLLEVQAAKESLKALTPAEVRAALEYRRLSVSERTP